MWAYFCNGPIFENCKATIITVCSELLIRLSNVCCTIRSLSASSTLVFDLFLCCSVTRMKRKVCWWVISLCAVFNVQRFTTVCEVSLRADTRVVLCVMKNLRNDQRAPGGQLCRKSDLVYLVYALVILSKSWKFSKNPFVKLNGTEGMRYLTRITHQQNTDSTTKILNLTTTRYMNTIQDLQSTQIHSDAVILSHSI